MQKASSVVRVQNECVVTRSFDQHVRLHRIPSQRACSRRSSAHLPFVRCVRAASRVRSGSPASSVARPRIMTSPDSRAICASMCAVPCTWTRVAYAGAVAKKCDGRPRGRQGRTRDEVSSHPIRPIHRAREVRKTHIIASRSFSCRNRCHAGDLFKVSRDRMVSSLMTGSSARASSKKRSAWGRPLVRVAIGLAVLVLPAVASARRGPRSRYHARAVSHRSMGSQDDFRVRLKAALALRRVERPMWPSRPCAER